MKVIQIIGHQIYLRLFLENIDIQKSYHMYIGCKNINLYLLIYTLSQINRAKYNLHFEYQIQQIKYLVRQHFLKIPNLVYNKALVICCNEYTRKYGPITEDR